MASLAAVQYLSSPCSSSMAASSSHHIFPSSHMVSSSQGAGAQVQPQAQWEALALTGLKTVMQERICRTISWA